MRIAAILSLAALPILSGCVAALLPIAALGTIGKGEIDRSKAKQAIVEVGAVDLAAPVVADSAEDAVIAKPAIGEDPLAAFSGRGGATAIPTVELSEEGRAYLARIFSSTGAQRKLPYADFTEFVLTQSIKMEAGEVLKSAVLVPRVDIFKPETIGCTGKPLAAIIDLDVDQGEDFTQADTVYRQDGLVEALRTFREAKVSVIWVSDKPIAASNLLAAILKEGGLSDDGSDDYLFLDRGKDDRKQVRRWDAARNYCVVAIAGDRRSDFDELYDYLRDPNGAVSLEHMFDAGWFMAPPPLVAKPSNLVAEAQLPPVDIETDAAEVSN